MRIGSINGLFLRQHPFSACLVTRGRPPLQRAAWGCSAKRVRQTKIFTQLPSSASDLYVRRTVYSGSSTDLQCRAASDSGRTPGEARFCPAICGVRQRRRPAYGTQFNDGADLVVSVQHPFRVQIRCRSPAGPESQADRHQDPGSQCNAGFQSRLHFRVKRCFVGFIQRCLRKRPGSAKSGAPTTPRFSFADAEGHSVERNATMH